jgi:hypothetical protein
MHNTLLQICVSSGLVEIRKKCILQILLILSAWSTEKNHNECNDRYMAQKILHNVMIFSSRKEFAINLLSYSFTYCIYIVHCTMYTETVFKEKRVWDPLPELTVTSKVTLCLLQSRLQYIYHGQLYARVDLNPSIDMTLTMHSVHLYM